MLAQDETLHTEALQACFEDQGHGHCKFEADRSHKTQIFLFFWIGFRVSGPKTLGLKASKPRSTIPTSLVELAELKVDGSQAGRCMPVGMILGLQERRKQRACRGKEIGAYPIHGFKRVVWVGMEPIKPPC